MLTWIISTIECNTVDRSKRSIQNEPSHAEFFRDIAIPMTHMAFGEVKRTRRSSDFDRGYADFLRNYHKDDIDRRGKYEVKESDEGDSVESSSKSDDEDGESESVESEENRKKHKTKSNGRNKKKKIEQTAPKKKSKHCKTEKRGNMLCNICYNPKNDEKSESCAYNSDPSENNKNYEYSEDTSYSTKDKKPENFESDSNENDESDESGEIEEKKKRPPINKNPVPNNRHQTQNGPRFNHPPPLPPPVHRPYLNPNQNYGPQTFLPQNFQPISLRPTGNSRPIRIQIKNSPPPVALIRYRTVESPFGNQHIRLITYPSGPPSSYPPQNRHQNRPPAPPPPPQSPSAQYYKNRRPTAAAQEFRPPRDINGAHSESLVSNITKEHPFDYLLNQYNSANREYARFMGKDWSGCRHGKAMENNQVCFECFVDGERRTECMFANANRPENFHTSYSKSKKYNTHHPYTFDLPIATVSKHSKFTEQKTQSHSDEHNKNKDYSVEQFSGDSNSDERFNADLKSNKVQSNNSSDWNVQHNGKHERPQAQPVHSSVSDIIYGKARPGPEPLALFFQSDPTIFDSISNSNTSNNNTNIDLNPKTSTNSTKST